MTMTDYYLRRDVLNNINSRFQTRTNRSPRHENPFLQIRHNDEDVFSPHFDPSIVDGKRSNDALFCVAKTFLLELPNDVLYVVVAAFLIAWWMAIGCRIPQKTRSVARFGLLPFAKLRLGDLMLSSVCSLQLISLAHKQGKSRTLSLSSYKRRSDGGKRNRHSFCLVADAAPSVTLPV